MIAKCMLMENAPLPNLVAKFVDGITINYSLTTGKAKLFESGVGVGVGVGGSAGG